MVQDPVIVVPDGPFFPPNEGPLPPWETLPPQVTLLIVMAVVAGSVVLLWPLVKALARRIERGPGNLVRGDVEELRARLAALEGEADRPAVNGSEMELYQLEERVEFLERLLTRSGGEAQ